MQVLCVAVVCFALKGGLWQQPGEWQCWSLNSLHAASGAETTLSKGNLSTYWNHSAIDDACEVSRMGVSVREA